MDFFIFRIDPSPFWALPTFCDFFFIFFGGGISLKQVLRPIVLCHRENVALPKNWIEFYPLSNAAIRSSLATLFDTIQHSVKLVEGPPPPKKKRLKKVGRVQKGDGPVLEI